MLLPMMNLDCINEAAISYHIPAILIIAVLKTENGKIGTITPNKNKTYDIGPMAINSAWLSELKKYGITQQDIQYDMCVNIKMGALILSKKIVKRGDLSTGIGDYHSHNVILNTIYYQKVLINVSQITQLIN
jgi:hypothetical protein